jgi:hypothetical protein
VQDCWPTNLTTNWSTDRQPALLKAGAVAFQGAPKQSCWSNLHPKKPFHWNTIIPLKLRCKYMYHPLRITKLCISPTQCIYVFRMLLTSNCGHVLKQHQEAGLRNWHAVCFLWDRNWILNVICMNQRVIIKNISCISLQFISNFFLKFLNYIICSFISPGASNFYINSVGAPELEASSHCRRNWITNWLTGTEWRSYYYYYYYYYYWWGGTESLGICSSP